MAGVGSCSYNYSNFESSTVGVISDAPNYLSLEQQQQQEDGAAEEFADEGLVSASGAPLAGKSELKGPSHAARAGGCVVSSQEVLVVEEEEDELEGKVPGSSGDGAAALGTTSRDDGATTTSKGGRPRKQATMSQEQETPVPEIQQEGGIALWVKWRGKWRACIQCFPSDCSAATARAMPTYKQKTYVVVFFPNSRTYFWVDLDYACHITESPEPLAFGTHDSGRRAVENLNMPKHHMLRVLASNMLDISDRLPIKAVVESVQNVDAWKNFANEAVTAKEYLDISKMLVKLFSMIERRYYSPLWLEDGLSKWKAECEKANTTQAVENLNKELVNSILWEDVGVLWDAPEQAAVGSDWKEWKFAVMENRSLYPTIVPPSKSAMYVDDSQVKRRRMALEVDLSARKTKLKMRRSGEIDLNSLAPSAELNGFAETPRARGTTKAPLFSTKSEDGPGLTSSKRLAANYQLCAAYMEKKKRQCTRFPSQGSLYCCKHMRLADETPEAGRKLEVSEVTKKIGNSMEDVKKSEFSAEERSPAVDEPISEPRVPEVKFVSKVEKICQGVTKYGRRCTHRAKDKASLFCRKHSFADAPHLNSETGELLAIAEAAAGEDQVAEEDKEHENIETEVQAEGQGPYDSEDVKEGVSNKRKMDTRQAEGFAIPWHPKHIGRIIKSNSGQRVRCLGKCVTGEQCLHKSRPGSFYCEKHQPEEVEDVEPAFERRKQDSAAQVTLKAKSWLSRYMETSNRKSDDEDGDAPEKLLDWVLAEASKDLPAADCLMNIVTERKEKLGRFLELTESSKAALTDEGTSFHDDEETKLSDEQMEQQAEPEKVKCSICSDDFSEMTELGSHWKSAHTTEAHWFLKGYVCKDCNKEFTSKSSFERHAKADHESVPEVLGFTVCINCDEQFSDFEALWDHVVAAHSDSLSAMPMISLPENDDEVEEMKTEEVETERREHNKDVEEHMDEDIKEDSGEELFELSSGDDSVDDEDELPNGNGRAHKYKCKLCGKKFRALPDLGRHHQAVHMSAHVGTISKSGTAAGGGGGRSRNRTRHRMSSFLRIKAALHTVQKTKTQKKTEAPKLAGPPGDEEILSEAANACCETNLRAVLEKKYGTIPMELHATVVKLASNVNQTVKWTVDGYVCPQDCQSGGQVSERAADTRAHIFRKSTAIVKKKSIVLCEDISFGKETIPIPCVEDEDTEPCTCIQCREGKSFQVESLRPWETFKYITERMLDPSLGVDTKDSQIGCSCGRGRCTPKSCDHVYLFDNDNTEACDIWGEEMLGRFPYDDGGRIILQEGYLVYECNSSCMCYKNCPNRVLQRGVSVKLEIFKTRHKGWAVRAAQHIPRGTFVCEYLGEVLNDLEANRRGERYDQVGCSYLYDIDVHLNRGRSRRGSRVKPFVIDGSKYGNVSRFMNHSCSPNLVNYQVLVESMDYQLAHIGLFASRDILCGEELAYDYRYKLLPGRGCPCHCGASGCRGRLY